MIAAAPTKPAGFIRLAKREGQHDHLRVNKRTKNKIPGPFPSKMRRMRDAILLPDLFLKSPKVLFFAISTGNALSVVSPSTRQKSLMESVIVSDKEANEQQFARKKKQNHTLSQLPLGIPPTLSIPVFPSVFSGRKLLLADAGKSRWCPCESINNFEIFTIKASCSLFVFRFRAISCHP